MRKSILVLVLAAVVSLLLTGCSGGVEVKDVQTSELAEVSGVLVSKADMQDVQARILIKGDGDKVMLDSTFTLLESVKANAETPFEFILFSTDVLVNATLGYNPLSNIFAAMVEDQITCEILKDGKAVASFAIDGASIDVEKAILNLQQEAE